MKMLTWKCSDQNLYSRIMTWAWGSA